jgi:hypothetical protein
LQERGFDVATQSEIAERHAIDVIGGSGHCLKSLEYDVFARLVKRLLVTRRIEIRVAAGGTIISCRSVVTREAIFSGATVIACWATVVACGTIITCGAERTIGAIGARCAVIAHGTRPTSNAFVTSWSIIANWTGVTSFIPGSSNGTVELALGIHVAAFANGTTIAEGVFVSRGAVRAVRARSAVITSGTGTSVIANRTLVTRGTRSTGVSVVARRTCVADWSVVTCTTRRTACTCRTIGAAETALFLRRGITRDEVLSAAFRGWGVAGHQNAFWLVNTHGGTQQCRTKPSYQ